MGLGTIYDLYSAKNWLAGSFLAVRLDQNPGHYKLDGPCLDVELDAKIERICQRDLLLLTENGLLTSSGTEGKVKCTEFGDAMARYCIKFETMKILLSLGAKSKMSEIVSFNYLFQGRFFNSCSYRLYHRRKNTTTSA